MLAVRKPGRFVYLNQHGPNISPPPRIDPHTTSPKGAELNLVHVFRLDSDVCRFQSLNDLILRQRNITFPKTSFGKSKIPDCNIMVSRGGGGSGFDVGRVKVRLRIVLGYE